MKKLLLTFLPAATLFFSCNNNAADHSQAKADTLTSEIASKQVADDPEVKIHPVSHATFVLQYGDLTIYNDPNGGLKAFKGFGSPGIVLISDIHGDHLNQSTLDSLDLSNATIIAPQAVMEKLPESYAAIGTVLNNGEATTIKGATIKAIPMYNLPEAEDSRHPRGRGNGYVLTLGKKQIYIAGDTEDIAEMRALKDIDIAFVPMNLPYTMSVEQAADGVVAFAPKVVIPYHYRGQGGLSDVNKFKELVDASGKDIEVRLLNWY